MATRLDDPLATATLSGPERRTVQRFVAMLRDELGDDLLAVWLYGSRARGERPHPESDVDLLVIAEGNRERSRDARWTSARRPPKPRGRAPSPTPCIPTPSSGCAAVARSNPSSSRRSTATRSSCTEALCEPALGGVPGAGTGSSRRCAEDPQRGPSRRCRQRHLLRNAERRSRSPL